MIKVIDISVPKSWDELSQRQLTYILRTLVSVSRSHSDLSLSSSVEFSQVCIETVKSYALVHFTGAKVVCRYGNGWLLRFGKVEVPIEVWQWHSLCSALNWIGETPKSPVRLDRISHRKCRYNASLDDLTFESWLSLENLWTGYLYTRSDDLLSQMADILYFPGRHPKPYELLSVFYWWSAIKSMAMERYPDFFHPSNSDSECPSMHMLEESYNSQIRALTGGDISKTDTILASSAWVALQELNAKAREYAEIRSKYGE